MKTIYALIFFIINVLLVPNIQASKSLIESVHESLSKFNDKKCSDRKQHPIFNQDTHTLLDQMENFLLKDDPYSSPESHLRSITESIKSNLESAGSSLELVSSNKNLVNRDLLLAILEGVKKSLSLTEEEFIKYYNGLTSLKRQTFFSKYALDLHYVLADNKKSETEKEETFKHMIELFQFLVKEPKEKDLMKKFLMALKERIINTDNTVLVGISDLKEKDHPIFKDEFDEIRKMIVDDDDDMITLDTFVAGAKFSFAPYNITQDGIKMLGSVNEWKYSNLDDEKISVDFVLSSEDGKGHQQHKAKNLGDYVSSVLSVYRHALGAELPYKPISVILYGSNKRKYVPPDGQPQSIESTNSAESGSSKIAVFREEEELKTLIHEMTHTLDLEKKIDDRTGKWVAEKFKVERLDGVVPIANEAVTESLAILNNMLLLAKRKNLNPDELWRKERKFQLIQVAKLLKQQGFKKFNDLLKDGSQDSSTLFKENTSTFEYYILKFLLMNNIDNFHRFAQNLAKPYPEDPSQKEKHKEDIHKDFIRLIEATLENPKTAQEIDSIMRKLDKKSKDSSFLFRTQRMSLYEDII